MNGLDCSMIRNVRVPHEQFVAIKNKAQYLIVEDRDKGGCITFTRDKKMSDEEAEKMINDMRSELDELKKKTDRLMKIYKTYKKEKRKCGIIYE